MATQVTNYQCPACTGTLHFVGESGLLDELVRQGVEEEDTILIGEYQFDYIF